MGSCPMSYSSDFVHIEPTDLLRPLDGSRLKIVRAQQHLKLLSAKIGRNIKRHSEEIVMSDTEKNSCTRTRRLTKPLPVHWSTLVGDCVTNARAALDYIMWKLICRYFDPP